MREDEFDTGKTFYNLSSEETRTARSLAELLADYLVDQHRVFDLTEDRKRELLISYIERAANFCYSLGRSRAFQDFIGRYPEAMWYEDSYPDDGLG